MDAAIDDSCVLFTIREEGLHSLSGGSSVHLISPSHPTFGMQPLYEERADLSNPLFS